MENKEVQRIWDYLHDIMAQHAKEIIALNELIDSIPAERFLKMDRWPMFMSKSKLEEIHDLISKKASPTINPEQ